MGMGARLPSPPVALRDLRFRLPAWLPTALVGLGIYIVVLVAHANDWINQYWYGVIQMAVVAAISALGLNLIYGFNGQFSLGHVGFYAIGAYTSALITKDFASRWSGGQFVALSWILSGQAGLLAALLLANWLHIGAAREALGQWLARQVPRHEAAVLKAVAGLSLLLVALAGGVLVAWGLRLALLPALDLVLSHLPEALAQPVVFVLALLAGASLAALVAYLVGLPLCGSAPTISASLRWALPSWSHGAAELGPGDRYHERRARHGRHPPVDDLVVGLWRPGSGGHRHAQPGAL